MKRQEHYAFTILELIFVIAIIGVMSTFGISLYQKQTEVNKISQATLQIQQLLQAGDYFYIQNTDPITQSHLWPEYNSATSTYLQGSSASCSNGWQLCKYSPHGTTNWVNPWGFPYTWQAVRKQKIVPYLFKVTTTTASPSQAAHLAAKLPAVSVTGTTISAYIAPPGFSYPYSPARIVAMGSGSAVGLHTKYMHTTVAANSGYMIPNVTCGLNATPVALPGTNQANVVLHSGLGQYHLLAFAATGPAPFPPPPDINITVSGLATSANIVPGGTGSGAYLYINSSSIALCVKNRPNP